MSNLKDIERRAEAYDQARDRLKLLVEELTAGIDALNRGRLPAIRHAVKRATELHEQLRQAIEAAPELFAKPRTQIMHGIKLGYQKGKGALEWDDEARVMARIRQQLPGQVDYLIACKYTPIKDALLKLPATDLKKLGVRVVGTDDEIVIRPVDGSVEKMTAALLKSAIDEAAGS